MSYPPPIPGEWEPRFVASWLCLKERRDGKTAEVIRLNPDTILGPRVARMYEGWLNGNKVYDPRDEFKCGQIVPLDDA